MRVKDLMTCPAETVGASESVRAAAQRMRGTDVGLLPVVSEGQIVGIVTDRDITVRGTAEGRDPDRTRVRDVMTPQVITCSPDDEVSEAARLMVHKAIRRLLVVDSFGRLIGVISVDDLAAAAKDEGAGDVISRAEELPSPDGTRR
jgi:CBS domain-containing protein